MGREHWALAKAATFFLDFSNKMLNCIRKSDNFATKCMLRNQIEAKETFRGQAGAGHFPIAFAWCVASAIRTRARRRHCSFECKKKINAKALKIRCIRKATILSPLTSIKIQVSKMVEKKTNHVRFCVCATSGRSATSLRNGNRTTK